MKMLGNTKYFDGVYLIVARLLPFKELSSACSGVTHARYTHEDFIATTEGNTFFPVVFIGQDEMEDNIRRVRAATEEVMGD